ncbi:DsbA family protein [Candidatus Gracilibacteria bacterium]|nr:DsbA family protein [Candidatus Gracilibacteria bacterium]
MSFSMIFFATQLGNNGGGADFQARVIAALEDYVDDEKPTEAPAAPAPITEDMSDDDAIKGDPDAPVTIVEFSDYQCPFCSKFFRETLPKIQSAYIDTGKVNLVYRDFPLSFHPGAFPMANLAECVRDQGNDDDYFAMHDEIFGTIDAGYNLEALIDFAVSELGSDEDQLRECQTSDKFKAEIAKDQADGQRAGISGTPGFVIGGQRISGAQPFPVFEAAIEAALAQGM